MPSEVQDALITILSEKALPCPSSTPRCRRVPGFNLIATANDRDRGVNELSSALRRRFNTVRPAAARRRRRRRWPSSPGASPSSARRWRCPTCRRAADEIRRVVTVFRELRDGVTDDGRISLKVADGHAVHGGGDLGGHQRIGPRRPLRRRARCAPADLADGIVGAVVKDPVHDDGRLAGVPRGGGAGPRRLGGLLPRLPRALLTQRVGAGATSRCTSSASATTGRARPARRRALDAARSPTSCCIEGPPRPTPSLAWSADAGLVPPVALLGYDLDHPERAVFSPLAAFSPEWQACAGRSGTACAVRFIDLPAARRRSLRRREPGSDERRAARTRSAVDSAGRARRGGRIRPTPSGGGTTWSSTGDGEPVFDAVAEAMAAVRGRHDAAAAVRRPGGRRTCGGRSARGAPRARAGGRRVRGLARPGARSGRCAAPAAGRRRRCCAACRRSRWR